MHALNNLLGKIAIPSVIKVKQSFDDISIEDVEGNLFKLLSGYAAQIKPGSSIAITCGSRGINHYVTLVRTIVQFVRSCGANPFLVPSMGSHGGASAQGQENMLHKLGITEESVGAPIRSSMETVVIGTTEHGLPVYIDRLAYQADGIILLNRIKPHTSFRGEIESGLVKMLAIGLAKQQGAEMTHFLRYENMAENIISVGRIALSQLNILFGVASIENGYGKVAELHVLNKDEILTKEPVLLKRAWQLMPRIFLDEIDVLVVKEIGKDISGTGMDTNIIGRFHTRAAHGGPNTIKLGLLQLSNKSGGNANGMGMADFVTKRLYDQIDFESTYINTITSTEPNSTKLPMVLQDDRQVFQACVKLCGQLDINRIRMVVIENTKHLDEVYMSKFAVHSICCPERTHTDGCYIDIGFDSNGKMNLFPDHT